jgi:proteasome lid subunit RPN8/RPN11
MNDANKKSFLIHARMQSPREACGLLIVENGVETLVICKNKAEYDHQFIIDPMDYVMSEERGEVIGIVHSHPMNSPQPSEADKVACSQSKLKWHIVGCLTGEWFTLEPNGYEAPLIGREWCHGLLDCYSIIRDYYKRELNLEIPDYDRDFEWWRKGENLYLENFKDAGFSEVPIKEVQKHDVILMQIQSPVINHGAIYLGDEKMLHHLHKRLSSRDVYGGYWLRHTVKVVRHRSFIDAKN